ncbi:MAG: hypothetical protein K6B28_07510, partial [Lachnospiraceae bacterium]|nr:hypothetical protein [Lachnospiraceae bacterium]
MSKRRWLRSLVAMIALVSMLAENTYTVFAVDGQNIATEETQAAEQTEEASGAEETAETEETVEEPAAEGTTEESVTEGSAEEAPAEEISEEAGAGSEVTGETTEDISETSVEVSEPVTEQTEQVEEITEEVTETVEEVTEEVSNDRKAPGSDAASGAETEETLNTEEKVIDKEEKVDDVVMSVDVYEDETGKWIEIKGYDEIPLYINTEQMNDRDAFEIKIEGPEDILYDDILNNSLSKADSNVYTLENLNKKTVVIYISSLTEGMEAEYEVRERDGYPQLVLISAEEPEVEKEMSATSDGIKGAGYDEITISVDTDKLSDGNIYTLNIDTEAGVFFNDFSVSDGMITGLSNQDTSLSIYNLDSKEFSISITAEEEGNIVAEYEVDSVNNGIARMILKDAQEEEEKEEKENKKIEYNDSASGVTVTATLSTPDAIPDEAELRVTPITDSTADPYLEAMDNADDSKSHTLENTLLFDIAFIMKDEDGNEYEYEPKEGSVTINISLSGSQLDKIGAESTEDVKVTHMPLEEGVKSEEELTVDKTDISADDIITETMSADTGGSEITFETESLSVYGVDTTGSSTGNNTATSAAEAVASGIDLTPMVSKVTINGEDIRKEGYTLPETDVYKLAVTFKENGSSQFGPIMYYKLPTGMQPDNTEVDYGEITLSGSYGDGGTALSGTIDFAYHVETDSSGNCYLIVEMDTTSDNYKYIDVVGNATFQVGISATLEESATEIKFAGSDYLEGEVTITKKEETDDDSTSFTEKKTATLSEDGKKIHYVSVTTASGNTQNVRIVDTNDNPSYLSLDTGSIKVTSSTGRSDLVVVTDGTDEKEMWHIGDVITQNSDGTYSGGISMSKGETITVEYDCNVTGISDELLKDISVTNTVTVWRKYNWMTSDSETVALHEYDIDIQKSGVYDKTSSTVTYTLTVNSDKSANVKGLRVKDHLSGTIKPWAEYAGEGIYVSIDDSASTLVPWSSVRGADGYGLDAVNAGQVFYYTPISTKSDYSGYNKIVLTYKVKVSEDEIITSGNLRNKVDLGYSNEQGVYPGHGESEIPFYPDPDNKLSVKKTVVESSNEQVTWKITFTVPEAGYDSCMLTEMLPKKDGYVDDLIGDIQVSSSDGSAVYYSRYDDDDSITLVFHKDKDGDEDGFAAGNTRTITVLLTTEIDPDWYAKVVENMWYYRTHTNTVYIDANGIQKSAEASVDTDNNRTMIKSSQGYKTVTVDGTEYPKFEYQLQLYDVAEDSIEIQEVFDDHLKIYNPTGAEVYLMSGWYSDSPVQGTVTEPTDADPFTKITFTDIPKQKDGSYYDLYTIYYSLIPDGEEGLQYMREQSAINNGFVVENSASWMGRTATATQTYTFSDGSVGKSETAKPSKENDYIGQYSIVVNEAGYTYGNEEYLDVYDVMTNLKLMVGSSYPIKITYGDGTIENDVNPIWSSEKNAWNFKIKNGVSATITYYAQVIGELNQKVKYSNAVSFFGYESSTQSTEIEKGKATGSVVTKTLILNKKATEDRNPLPGATFRLYRWKGSKDASAITTDESKWEPVSGNDGYVERTTNSAGSASFCGNRHEDGWFLDVDEFYALKEIAAPAGYILDETIHPFIVQNVYAINDKPECLTVIPVDGDGGISITNEKAPTTEFSIKKVSSDTGETLAGAKFKLTPPEGSATEEQTYTTGKNGIVTFTGLYAGETYTLTEESVPEG